ncbi:MAG: type II toxin-antitoxin system RelE/ParE family toxin [Lentisphaeria bacterium]|nr:type II toxin-antitoxin system RelE/ParE family toxin [Lentisphaeria bacterium]
MNVRWSYESSEDLKAIYNYIANDSEYYASATIEKILNLENLLIENPLLGRVVAEYLTCS